MELKVGMFVKTKKRVANDSDDSWMLAVLISGYHLGLSVYDNIFSIKYIDTKGNITFNEIDGVYPESIVAEVFNNAHYEEEQQINWEGTNGRCMILYMIHELPSLPNDERRFRLERVFCENKNFSQEELDALKEKPWCYNI